MRHSGLFSTERQAIQTKQAPNREDELHTEMPQLTGKFGPTHRVSSTGLLDDARSKIDGLSVFLLEFTLK